MDGIEGLNRSELAALAARIRAALVEKVCAAGGHLGSNLGVVELTIALHRVFDSPHDALVFDTGHQAYVHKMLTGRWARFDSLRAEGGLSGYPSRGESEHDLVENSHASTALSYADGLAKARQLRGEGDRVVVAVIGDGALSGGMAWEAMNNLGAAPDRPVVVVLNDNGRSYAPTGGALGSLLAALRSGASGSRNLFTDLGFSYLGPINGGDIYAVESALRTARSLRRPAVVHVVTVKGRGYQPAEDDVLDCLHAVGVVDPVTGRPAASSGARSLTGVFEQELLALADERPDLVAITAAMTQPTGLRAMALRYPERVFDVGIAEQQAVTSAAGLAMGGLHPIAAIYSTFLNRAFDQVLLDVALHRLPVTLVLDRAGITGPDGASHHGMWDLSILSAVPGLRLAAPRDAARLTELLREAVAVDDGPTVLRLPKSDAGPPLAAMARIDGIDILLRTPGKPLDVLIVAVGPLAEAAMAAAAVLEEHGLGVTVADPRWVVPINEALPGLVARHRLVATVEDGVRIGGVGAMLTQACQDAGVDVPIRVLGLPRAFIPHGSRAGLLARFGLDGPGIASSVLTAVRRPHHESHLLGHAFDSGSAAGQAAPFAADHGGERAGW